MRIRVVKPTKAYWNYSIQTWNPDDEVDGELARHLADNAPRGHVEVIEDDRDEVREAQKEPQEPSGPGDPNGQGGDGNEGDPPAGPPVDGTIDDLVRWVGDDPERARQALEAEQAKDKPRSTVVKRLAALTGDDN